jgi:putative acetyltransferase
MGTMGSLSINPEIIIRPAVRSDSKSVCLMCCESVLKSCTQDYSGEQVKVWSNRLLLSDRMEDRIQTDECWLATAHDKIIGFISLKRGNELDFLYVHPDHQHNGVALKLLETLLSHTGNRTLKAFVSKTALPFFLRQGFVVRRENLAQIDQITLVNYLMEKA